MARRVRNRLLNGSGVGRLCSQVHRHEAGAECRDVDPQLEGVAGLVRNQWKMPGHSSGRRFQLWIELGHEQPNQPVGGLADRVFASLPFGDLGFVGAKVARELLAAEGDVPAQEAELFARHTRRVFGDQGAGDRPMNLLRKRQDHVLVSACFTPGDLYAFEHDMSEAALGVLEVAPLKGRRRPAIRTSFHLLLLPDGDEHRALSLELEHDRDPVIVGGPAFDAIDPVPGSQIRLRRPEDRARTGNRQDVAHDEVVIGEFLAKVAGQADRASRQAADQLSFCLIVGQRVLHARWDNTNYNGQFSRGVFNCGSTHMRNKPRP